MLGGPSTVVAATEWAGSSGRPASAVRTGPDGGNGIGGGSGRVDSGDVGGGLADSVVNSALRFRAQAPLIDQLLREIGVQGGDVGRVAQGLLDRTQGSSGPPVPARTPGE